MRLIHCFCASSDCSDDFFFSSVGFRFLKDDHSFVIVPLVLTFLPYVLLFRHFLPSPTFSLRLPAFSCLFLSLFDYIFLFLLNSAFSVFTCLHLSISSCFRLFGFCAWFRISKGRLLAAQMRFCLILFWVEVPFIGTFVALPYFSDASKYLVTQLVSVSHHAHLSRMHVRY